jgi:hypothetical protein
MFTVATRPATLAAASALSTGFRTISLGAFLHGCAVVLGLSQNTQTLVTSASIPHSCHCVMASLYSYSK